MPTEQISTPVLAFLGVVAAVTFAVTFASYPFSGDRAGGERVAVTQQAGAASTIWEGGDAGATATAAPDPQQGDDAQLRVHIRTPATLQAGQVRQLRLQVERASLRGGGALDADQLLEIDVSVNPGSSVRGSVWVRPSRVLLPYRAVGRTPIHVTVHTDVACDTSLGDIEVRVRSIATDEVVVASDPLPVVTCPESPPPPAPDTVHDTDLDCGGELRANPRVGGSHDTAADVACLDYPPPPPPPPPLPPPPPSTPEPDVEDGEGDDAEDEVAGEDEAGGDDEDADESEADTADGASDPDDGGASAADDAGASDPDDGNGEGQSVDDEDGDVGRAAGADGTAAGDARDGDASSSMDDDRGDG